MTNIFVGNLDITLTEQQLRDVFAGFGVVGTVSLVMDRDTGEPRRIAFVEMMQAAEAQAAIAALDGTVLNGRPIRVNEARPKLDHHRTHDARGRDHRRHRI